MLYTSPYYDYNKPICVHNKSDYRRLLCVNESSALHLSTHAADRRFKQDSGVEQAVVDVNDVWTHEMSAHQNTNYSSSLVKEPYKTRTILFLCIWSRL